MRKLIKWLVLFVFLTLAFVSSAHAYTYICEEGRFTIDVPDGWQESSGFVENDRKEEGDICFYYEENDTSGMILIQWAQLSNPLWQSLGEYCLEGSFSLPGIHDNILWRDFDRRT